MAFLKKLKLAEGQNKSFVNPLARTKNRLLENLEMQLKAAEAMVNGEKYLVDKFAYTPAEDGSKVKTLVKRPVRKWYWRDANGLVRFTLRVRNKRLELSDGKTDIVVGEDKELPAAIRLVLEAVKAGELDKQINALIHAK